MLFSGEYSYHVISKYKQSDWFSRFLVMLSQQAQDSGRSVPDPYPLGTRLIGQGLGTGDLSVLLRGGRRGYGWWVKGWIWCCLRSETAACEGVC